MKLQKSIFLVLTALAGMAILHSEESKIIINSYEDYYQKPYVGIGNLKFFQQAYSDIIFERRYDSVKDDWIITLTIPNTPGNQDKNGRKVEFYWANGSFLPESELKNKDKYWSLLTYYPKEIRDPSTYSEKELDAINEYSSKDNREQGKGTPMFFFDEIYDTKTRGATEKHIKRIPFLNKKTNIHERIEAPMKRVELKIKEVAKTDREIADFIKTIKTYDSYAWREIRGTGRRSFHGLGLATDVMPRYLNGKHIFWSWTKDKFPTRWMTVPLNKRWIPPAKIIEIFESEGFIWGGKWVIYDNMHFEYHPELILYNSQENLFPKK